VKLSYKELLESPAGAENSFEGSFEYTEGDFKVSVKSFRADFLPTDAGLYLDLNFEYEYLAPCDRCLEETKEFGAERAGIQLVAQYDESPKEEVILGDDDMGITYLDSDEIDLHEIVKSEVDYFLPLRMVCGEDCLGLCHSCGENLNTGKCSCEKEVDPRWSALKNIKKN
jgi:uncharacterized protein